MLRLLPFLTGLAVLLFAPDGPRYAVVGAALCAFGIPGMLEAYRRNRADLRRRDEALDQAEKALEDIEKRLDADLAREREEERGA